MSIIQEALRRSREEQEQAGADGQDASVIRPPSSPDSNLSLKSKDESAPESQPQSLFKPPKPIRKKKKNPRLLQALVIFIAGILILGVICDAAFFDSRYTSMLVGSAGSDATDASQAQQALIPTKVTAAERKDQQEPASQKPAAAPTFVSAPIQKARSVVDSVNSAQSSAQAELAGAPGPEATEPKRPEKSDASPAAPVRDETQKLQTAPKQPKPRPESKASPPPPQKPLEPVYWPKLKLSAIVRNTQGKSAAILNNNLVDIGAEINGVTLLEILPNGDVRLQCGHETMLLRVGQTTF